MDKVGEHQGCEQRACARRGRGFGRIATLVGKRSGRSGRRRAAADARSRNPTSDNLWAWAPQSISWTPTVCDKKQPTCNHSTVEAMHSSARVFPKRAFLTDSPNDAVSEKIGQHHMKPPSMPLLTPRRRGQSSRSCLGATRGTTEAGSEDRAGVAPTSARHRCTSRGLAHVSFSWARG